MDFIRDDAGIDNFKAGLLQHGLHSRTAGICTLPAGALVADGDDGSRIAHVSASL